MRGTYSSKSCFLFDLDGTLVDSTAAHTAAYIGALAAIAAPQAATFRYASFAGRPTRETFLDLGFSATETDSLTRHKQQLYRLAIERGEITLFPGAQLLLERLQQRNDRLFLVTSASRRSTEQVLAATDLAHFFEGVTTAEDVRRGKPAPDPYLIPVVAGRLDEAACVVIEDAAAGAAAALSAGLDVVLVHTDLVWPGADNVGDFARLQDLLFA